MKLIPDTGGRVLYIQRVQEPSLLFKPWDVPGCGIDDTTARSAAKHMETVQGARRVHLGKAAITSLDGAACFEPRKSHQARTADGQPSPRGASQALLPVSAGTMAQLCSWDPQECETSCRNIRAAPHSAREAAAKPQRQRRLQRQAPAPRAARGELQAQHTGCGHRDTHDTPGASPELATAPAARSAAKGAGLRGEAAPRHQSGLKKGLGNAKP